MTTARVRTILPIIGITAMAVLLTACSGGGNGAATAAHPPTGASTGTSTSASPTTGPTTAPSRSTPAATAPSTVGSTSAPAPSRGSGTAAAPAPAGTGASAAGARCATSQLSGSVADGGGSSAGATRVAIILRNTGAQSCTLQGWPGISFVGGGNGTQIGNAATLDRSTPHQTLTLRPSGEVQAVVTVRDAGDWDSATCHPRVTDGFRVIPPGSRQALFVPASGALFESCAAPAVHQLSTSALASF
ncbi:DUF4232 domain-containing protein [Curtobacterium sp. VKM Ac-2865]|uniref:DUF4232 domain-containing protein n=1 Tax=Curtobacterium sp. VKM Ac-2865 TaxID=2783817 RepID=UPI00188A8044|nr:DUF4232 domain-containing protein [Curtobacterium sp. VKM Ac-2865]MBF4582536.1 DUF4232 domain-containing protein [Curtobacterium sp. VKM Ac-2865]